MITVVFFHNNSTNIFYKTLSSIIQFFEGNSQISHAAIGLEVNGQPYLLQAVWGGVQLAPRSDETSTHSVVAEFEILPSIENELATAESKVGESYDVLTLIGYIFVILGQDLHIGVNNPFYSKSGTVCSEFVIEVDTQHLIHEFDGLDPANIDPADLYNICLNGPSFKRLS